MFTIIDEIEQAQLVFAIAALECQQDCKTGNVDNALLFFDTMKAADRTIKSLEKEAQLSMF